MTKAAIERGRAACRELENLPLEALLHLEYEDRSGLGSTLLPYKVGTRSYISNELMLAGVKRKMVERSKLAELRIQVRNCVVTCGKTCSQGLRVMRRKDLYTFQ